MTQYPEIPFAFLSAAVEEAVMRRVEETGAPLFLKPVELADLLACLEIMIPAA